jgi:hypothetical protein
MGKKSRRKREQRESRPGGGDAPPSFPPELVAYLRKAVEKSRQAIDPFQTYRLDLGNGLIHECTGADLIATGEAQLAFAEAVNRGEDRRVLLAALARMQRTLP